MKKLIALLLILSMQCLAARKFNGTNQGLNSQTQAWLPNSPAATSLTIAFWLYVDSFGSGDKLALETTTNYNTTNGAIIVNSGGTCGGSNGFYFGETTSTVGPAQRLRRFAQPSSATWHHYMFTLTNDNSDYRAYVDGTSQSLTNCDAGSPGTTTFAATGIVLYLMNRGLASLFLAGRMAQVGIWLNKRLSANEAKSLASCVEPWQIQAESLAFYAPLWGVDSPEPSLAQLQIRSLGTTVSMALSNAPTFVGGPPLCAGVH